MDPFGTLRDTYHLGPQSLLQNTQTPRDVGEHTGIFDDFPDRCIFELS